MRPYIFWRPQILLIISIIIIVVGLCIFLPRDKQVQAPVPTIANEDSYLLLCTADIYQNNDFAFRTLEIPTQEHPCNKNAIFFKVNIFDVFTLATTTATTTKK